MKKIGLFVALLWYVQVFAGTISRSATALPGFGQVFIFHSSTSIRYTVSATSLSGNLLITADNGFEISLQYASNYSKSISMIPVSGNVASTTIFVRFSPSATGSFSGNITHSSPGSTTLLTAVSGTGINWNIPSGYYSTINTQRGSSLKTALYNKISTGTTSLSYAAIWTAFNTTDVQPNGKVWDIYSTRFDQASPYEYTLGSDQCGTYSVEGDCYNREHTFPQSWFGSSSPMQSDLHHVMASDGKVNGERGNFPFGNVTSTVYTSLYGGKRGTGSTNFSYSGTVFEPIDEYKGDIARAQLYMVTRYENLVAGWQNNSNANDVLAGNSFPAYDSWYINLLLSWHHLDPVSDKERKRNQAINTQQGNRNPFIDSPQFVQRIWGGSIATEPNLSSTNLTITNINTTSIQLNWVSGNGQRRLVIVRAGAPVNQWPVDTIHYSANNNLSSAPSLGSGNMIVYNGTGSYITLTNLLPNTTYHYAVIEYNGWYTTSNYRTSGVLTGSSITLPVSWLSCNATLQDESVLLEWSTASEQNNDFFTIERSDDGLVFYPLGRVNGQGTTNRISYYTYIDTGWIASPIVFYRIKQTDYDGAFSYSEVQTITNHLGTARFTMYPNPVSSGTCSIVLESVGVPASVVVYDMSGKSIRSQLCTEGKLELNGLTTGIYVVCVTQGTMQTRQKLVMY